MIRKERRVRVKRQLGRAGGGGGGTVVSVRELYLRDDVPCRSLACPASCPDMAPLPEAVLPVDATHYVVPDFSVGKDFLELLELPCLRSQAILFFQTVASFVQVDYMVFGVFLVAYMRLENSLCRSVRRSVRPLVGHAVEIFAEKLSKPYPSPFPPERDRCCRVYGFVGVF